MRDRVQNILGGDQGDIFLEEPAIEVHCSATEISYVDKTQNAKAKALLKTSE